MPSEGLHLADCRHPSRANSLLEADHPGSARSGDTPFRELLQKLPPPIRARRMKERFVPASLHHHSMVLGATRGRLRWPRPSRVSPSAWLNAVPALCKGGSPQACDDLLGRQTGRLLLHRNPRRLVRLEGAANIHGRQTELHRLQRQRRTRWTERPGAAARENAKYLGECQG